MTLTILSHDFVESNIHTISSLQIGQTKRDDAVEAAAATFSRACSSIAVLISSPSLEDFDVETSDSSDRVLAEGDNNPGGLRWSWSASEGEGDGGAGLAAAPRTLPLPIVLDAAISMGQNGQGHAIRSTRRRCERHFLMAENGGRMFATRS